MKLLLVALAAAPALQEPGTSAAAHILLEDVRAWLREDELPASEDVAALLGEVEVLTAQPAGATALVLLREIGELGHRLGAAGRDGEARHVVEWVAERAGACDDHATRSWALEWLGQEAWVRGELDGAAGLLARAAEADESRRAGLERVRHLADVARIRLTQGRFDEAQREIERAEEAARGAPSSSAAARIAAEVRGSLFFELGRHRDALAACLGGSSAAAPGPAPAGSGPHDEVQVRLDVLAADILADVGRLDSAVAFARRALAIAREPAVREVAPLLHLEAELALGLLLADLGRGEEALALLDAAAAEFERLGDRRGLAWSEKNRGFALFAAGRQAEAVRHFERAWSAGAELGLPFLEGIGALGTAEALVFGGDASGRDERVQEALAVAERVAAAQHERTLAWRSSALRGRILLARGAHAEASRELGRAVRLIERWRRRLGASGLVEHALRQRSDPYRDAAFAAAHLGRMEEALGFAAMLQERVLDELAARRDAPLSAPGLEALRERIARLEHRLREPGADATARVELERELAREEDELDAALLASELASGRTLAGPEQRVPLETLAEGLARQGLDLALVHLVGEDETLVLRLHAGRPARLDGRILPVGRAWLAPRIEALLAPIARVEAGELDLAHLGFDVRAARELHAALVGPLELAPGARIGLVADGVLGAVPFELLVAGGELGRFEFARPFAHLAGLRWLGEEHALVSSASLARLARPLAPRATPALAFLAPAAGLPHAEEEGRMLARSLGGARIVPDATAGDVAREARGAGVVHFAAHGRIDAERPAHGHLELADEPGTGARLESWQAAELQLDGALVVLSACHSARGEWRPGAGLAGLARGFLAAGASEVVASRWAVDDRATLRFMELFYAELARGSATPEALRAARSALCIETDSRRFALAHPAFWAAWSLQR